MIVEPAVKEKHSCRMSFRLETFKGGESRDIAMKNCQSRKTSDGERVSKMATTGPVSARNNVMIKESDSPPAEFAHCDVRMRRLKGFCTSLHQLLFCDLSFVAVFACCINKQPLITLSALVFPH